MADHTQHPHIEAAILRARLARRTRGLTQIRHARAAIAHLSQHEHDVPPMFGGDGHAAPALEAEMLKLIDRAR